MYALTEPHQSGLFPVSDLHQIYYEVSGNPNGKPVIFLHGGPGGGASPEHRRFFNPDAYRIIIIDQRGCGRSLPYACIEENTIWDLIADIEKLRIFLDIEKWLVFGGSWGSTLSLAYAQTHPEHVAGLVLRGIFLARPSENEWLYVHGANTVFPEYWQAFTDMLPENCTDPIAAYQTLLAPTNPNHTQMLTAARAWAQWESHIVCLQHNQAAVDEYENGENALAIARIENHYFAHQCWLDGEHDLLNNINKIKHIPTIIVQGRYDICTPPQAAWDLKQAFMSADLRMTDAGHSAFEPHTANELVRATDEMLEQAHWG